MTIWKYQLAMIDDQKIEMPRKARILSVQVQDDVPCLWALVDDDAPTEQRAVRIAGTGHRVSGWSAENFVGTVQLAGGTLVFHVFVD